MRTKRDIGKRVRAYREKNKLTQQDLAELIGVRGSYISGIEIGTNLISPKALGSMASVLNITNKEATSMLNILVKEATDKVTSLYREGKEYGRRRKDSGVDC